MTEAEMQALPPGAYFALWAPSATDIIVKDENGEWTFYDGGGKLEQLPDEVFSCE